MKNIDTMILGLTIAILVVLLSTWEFLQESKIKKLETRTEMLEGPWSDMSIDTSIAVIKLMPEILSGSTIDSIKVSMEYANKIKKYIYSEKQADARKRWPFEKRIRQVCFENQWREYTEIMNVDSKSNFDDAVTVCVGKFKTRVR